MNAYVDYMIKYSENQIKIETIQKIESKQFYELNESEKAFFFYNMRENLRDIIIALCYLKSRFIGDFRWFQIENLGFNIIHNHIVLSNYLNLDLNVLPEVSNSSNLNKPSTKFISLNNSNDNMCKFNNLKPLKFNLFQSKIPNSSQ